MDKTKVIIFSSLGLAVLAVGFLFFRAASGSKKGSSETVEVNSKVDEKFTYKEMMAANSKGVNKDYDTLANYTVPSYGGQQLSDQAALHQEPEPAAMSEEEARLNEAIKNVKKTKEPNYYNQENTTQIRRVQKEIIQQQSPPATKIITNRPPVTYNIPNNDLSSDQGKRPSSGKVIFYDNDVADVKTNGNRSNTLQAVAHGDQTVIDGGTIKIRTTQEAILNDVVFPKNTIIYGSVRFENNRVSIQVSSIKRDGGSIYVNLLAYDQRDGRPGLNVEGGNITEDLREATERVTDEATSRIDNIPVVGSVTRGVKNVFSGRRNRTQSIVISSNHKLFLR